MTKQADVQAGGLMAILHPPLEALTQLVTPLNDGELRVARALAEQLDDLWTVYIQPRLELDVPDFVAVHHLHGVCAIEVKDWSYGKYRVASNGAIQYRNGQGWTDSGQNPRYQAYRYRSTIFEQFFALPGDSGCIQPAVSAIVLLLNHSTEHARRLLDHKQVPPAQSAIQVFGDDVLISIENAITGPSPATPSPVSLERFRRHLAISSVMSELTEPQLLSDGARNIEANRGNALIRRVRGSAGCGKSFGLAARAARLASEGKSVLVLSYNATLAHYLRSLVSSHCASYAANPTRVTCTHFHALCARVADDAMMRGIQLTVPPITKPYDQNVAKAQSAFDQGFQLGFDAILVDEGQDFTQDWWNMLRHHALKPGGEMLLVSDPTQDVYAVKSWTDERSMRGAGFNGPWTDLQGSYRLPLDMVAVAAEFAQRYVRGDRISTTIPVDRAAISGRSTRTERRWIQAKAAGGLGAAIGEATVELLRAHPDLCATDVVFLCESHDQGLAAVRVLERDGYDVHHIFAKSDQEKRQRKARFWPEAPGVKGCTVHSFKGWESRAVVMGIGTNSKSRRLAYVAMTRLKADGHGRAAHVSVVSADPGLEPFGELFVRPIESWPPPHASCRIA